MTANLTVGALFAGYGGIELALHEVFGAEPAWFAEFDAAPSRVLAHHWPDVPNHGDVTAIDWSAVEPVDIIAGGSPCQDLSHAGKRAGMKAGTRSGLWASMCDAIDTIRPSLVVWENVRGALSAPADSAVEPCPICVGDRPGVSLRALGRVLGDLAELGYDAAWHGLRAADVGAPHGRWRVFLIAWKHNDTEPIATRPGAGRVAGDAAVLTLLPTPQVLLPTPAVNDMGSSYTPEQWDEWTARMKAEHGNGNGHGASLHVEAQRMLLPTPSVAAEQRFGRYAPAITRWSTILRPAPDPTEPTGKNGAHRLSPRFVEWMMGLPDGWVTNVPGVSRNEALKALGNGVVPQQAAVAVRRLLAVRASVTEVAA